MVFLYLSSVDLKEDIKQKARVWLSVMITRFWLLDNYFRWRASAL